MSLARTGCEVQGSIEWLDGLPLHSKPEIDQQKAVLSGAHNVVRADISMHILEAVKLG